MSEVLLLLVQVDDASGEVLGRVLEQLSEAGARNTQLLAGLTKKGRPGHTLLDDVPADLEDDIAAILVGELGVWGYRVLRSEHKHFDIQHGTAAVELHGERCVHRFELRVKHIHHEGLPVRVKVEHDDLVRVCRELADAGDPEYLAVLKSQIEAALGSRSDGAPLVIASRSKRLDR